MSAPSPLPAALEVRELIEGLLGRDLDVTVGAAAVDPAAPGGAMVGVFVDDMLKLKTIIVVDLALAANVGAAIGLIPAQAARTAVEEERLTPALYENAAEILNVSASLFNHEGAPHVRLYEAYAPREALPPDVTQWVLAYVRRLDLEVAIAGYDSGRMSILAL